MFKEIKRKITLFNTLTLVAFLVIFITIIGIFVGWILAHSGEEYLAETAQTLIRSFSRENPPLFSDRSVGGIDPKRDEPEMEKPSVRDDLGYDFIIWDDAHNVLAKSVGNDDLMVYGHELELNKKDSEPFNVFKIGNMNYRVYSTVFQSRTSECTLQVYQIINSEKIITQYLVIFLVGVGILGILILIPLSYFLSGVSLRPVNETFEQQKKFIADASHELRTPLTVIQTNVEVLRMKEDEVLADNIRWLNNIQSESETMARLIKELLLIAQADNHKIALEKEVFDISALCAEVVDLMFEVAQDQDVLLKGAIPKGVEYYGDSEKLKQAIRILIDNAIKYTPGEGMVTLTLLENSRNVIVAVQDTGVGLSEEDQKKVFSRFYRVDNARHRESGGVGLGLNIADMVVKGHGGKIEIDSVLDQGSTFSIVLPKSSHVQGSKPVQEDANDTL